MFRNRKKGTSRWFKWETPLNRIEKEQRRPRFFEEDNLISESKTCKTRQVFCPFDGHEKKSSTCFVNCFMCVAIQWWANKVWHHDTFPIVAIFIFLVVCRNFDFNGIICEQMEKFPNWRRASSVWVEWKCDGSRIKIKMEQKICGKAKNRLVISSPKSLNFVFIYHRFLNDAVTQNQLMKTFLH